MINQQVVERLTKAIWMYNAGIDYVEISHYLEVPVDVAVKMVQAANIIEGIEL